MKRFILLLIIISAVPCVCGTEVSLDIDKTNITLGESVVFHLVVELSKPTGGHFLVEIEESPRRYSLVHQFLEYSSCSSCGGQPLSQDVNEDYTYTPKEAGNYVAEANFDGKWDKVEFTVSAVTTTSTSSTSTTTSTSTILATSIPCIPVHCNRLCYIYCGCINDTQKCMAIEGAGMVCRNPRCPMDEDCVCDTTSTSSLPTSTSVEENMGDGMFSLSSLVFYMLVLIIILAVFTFLLKSRK